MRDGELQVGDIVELKSGGPNMTVVVVVELQTGISAHCTWFPSHEDYRTGVFPALALKKVKNN